MEEDSRQDEPPKLEEISAEVFDKCNSVVREVKSSIIVADQNLSDVIGNGLQKARSLEANSLTISLGEKTRCNNVIQEVKSSIVDADRNLSDIIDHSVQEEHSFKEPSVMRISNENNLSTRVHLNSSNDVPEGCQDIFTRDQNTSDVLGVDLLEQSDSLDMIPEFLHSTSNSIINADSQLANLINTEAFASDRLWIEDHVQQVQQNIIKADQMLSAITDVDPSIRNSIQDAREAIIAADRRLSNLLDGHKSTSDHLAKVRNNILIADVNLSALVDRRSYEDPSKILDEVKENILSADRELALLMDDHQVELHSIRESILNADRSLALLVETGLADRPKEPIFDMTHIRENVLKADQALAVFIDSNDIPQEKRISFHKIREAILGADEKLSMAIENQREAIQEELKKKPIERKKTELELLREKCATLEKQVSKQELAIGRLKESFFKSLISPCPWSLFSREWNALHHSEKKAFANIGGPQTLLHAALRSGHEEATLELLHAGADPTSTFTFTASEVARMQMNLSFFQLLAEHHSEKDPQNILELALFQNSDHCLQIVISQMNEIIRQGKNAQLIEQIYAEMAKAFRTLIIRQDMGGFSNMWAMLPETIQQKIVRVSTDSGETLVHTCLEHANMKAAKDILPLILKAKPDVNAKVIRDGKPVSVVEVAFNHPNTFMAAQMGKYLEESIQPAEEAAEAEFLKGIEEGFYKAIRERNWVVIHDTWALLDREKKVALLNSRRDNRTLSHHVIDLPPEHWMLTEKLLPLFLRAHIDELIKTELGNLNIMEFSLSLPDTNTSAITRIVELQKRRFQRGNRLEALKFFIRGFSFIFKHISDPHDFRLCWALLNRDIKEHIIAYYPECNERHESIMHSIARSSKWNEYLDEGDDTGLRESQLRYILKRLVKYKADVNEVDDYRDTPYERCMIAENNKIRVLLEEIGASKDGAKDRMLEDGFNAEVLDDYMKESPEVASFLSGESSNEGDPWMDCSEHPNYPHQIDISDTPMINLEWVYGINGRVKNNLASLPSGEIVYSRGKVLVRYDVERHQQSFMQEHTNYIALLTQNPLNGFITASYQPTTPTEGGRFEPLGMIHIWNWEYGTCTSISNIDMHLEDMCFNCKGKLLICSNFTELRMLIFDVSRGSILHRLDLQPKSQCAGWHSTNPYGFFIAGESFITSFSIQEDGLKQESISWSIKFKQYSHNTFTCVTSHPSGLWILGTKHGGLAIVKHGKCVKFVKRVHESAVTHIAFQDEQILTAGLDGRVKRLNRKFASLWDTQLKYRPQAICTRGKAIVVVTADSELKEFEAGEESTLISCCDYLCNCESGGGLIAALPDKFIRWDLNRHYPKRSEPIDFTVSSMIVHGSILIVFSTDHHMYLFNAISFQHVTSIDLKTHSTFHDPEISDSELKTIVASAVSPDGDYLAVGTPWGQLFIFNFDDPETVTFDRSVSLKSYKPTKLIEWSVDSSNIRCTDSSNEVLWFELDRGFYDVPVTDGELPVKFVIENGRLIVEESSTSRIIRNSELVAIDSVPLEHTGREVVDILEWIPNARPPYTLRFQDISPCDIRIQQRQLKINFVQGLSEMETLFGGVNDVMKEANTEETNIEMARAVRKGARVIEVKSVNVVESEYNFERTIDMNNKLAVASLEMTYVFQYQPDLRNTKRVETSNEFLDVLWHRPRCPFTWRNKGTYDHRGRDVDITDLVEVQAGLVVTGDIFGQVSVYRDPKRIIVLPEKDGLQDKSNEKELQERAFVKETDLVTFQN